MSNKESVFLTAEWRDLLLLNFAVEPALLRTFVPRGTELDSFQGKTYVSLVGFRFCRMKYLGWIPIPFHSEFEEINLRFYVRRQMGTGIRRGVVFIAEIVPKPAIAKTARWVYGENYVCRKMEHNLASEGSEKIVSYGWNGAAGWCRLKAGIEKEPELPLQGSVEQFITEHYWGYSRQRDGDSLEYQVGHVPWRLWTAIQAEFAGDASELYGEAFAEVLRRPPDSAFVAEGSQVTVFGGRALAQTGEEFRAGI